MRLENLYQNFGKDSPEEQLKYIVAYRLRRMKDLEIIPSTKTKSVKGSQYDLSDEEKAVLKILGLKQKDIIALRAMNIAESEEKTNDEDLFKDSTFEGD